MTRKKNKTTRRRFLAGAALLVGTAFIATNQSVLGAFSLGGSGTATVTTTEQTTDTTTTQTGTTSFTTGLGEVSEQVPLVFGSSLACGYAGDEVTGEVVQPVFSSGYFDFAFPLETAESSIRVAVTALQQGSPSSPLTLDLYSGSALLASGSISAAQVPSGSPGWTPFVTLTPSSTMAPGDYHVKVSSPGSSLSSNYWVFMGLLGPSWWGGSGSYVPPPGYGGNSGYPVLWVEDQSGDTLFLSPFGDAITPPNSTTFVAASSYQVNCVMPWLSDMEFVPPKLGGPAGYKGTWTISDLTTGQTLGSATSTQYYDSHGVTGVLPMQLPSPVGIIGGHEYKIQLTEASDQYAILLRGSTVSPLSGSPSGVSPYWYGALGFADFSAYRVLDYPQSHILTEGNSGGIGGAAQVGVRFIPSQNENLQSVSILMYNGEGTQGNYPSGVSITASVYASNESAATTAGAAPSGSPLASASADSGTVPYNGFFEVPGFDFALTANTPYWIVWSASSAPVNAYVPNRCVSPFRNLLQVNGGSGWTYPAQGPSDIAWYAMTTVNTEGSPWAGALSLPIDTSTNFVAQPFSLSQAASVSAIYLQSTGNVRATIYPDNGAGTGPEISSPLATGTWNNIYQYFYSGAFVSLTTPADVPANAKYWIVLSAVSGTGTIGAAEYWTRPSDPSVPAGYEVLVSDNGGASWTQTSPDIASAIFMVGVVPQ